MSAEVQFEQLPNLSMSKILDFSLRPTHLNFHQPISRYYPNGQPEQAGNILHIHNLDLPKLWQVEIDKHSALHRWLYYFDHSNKTPYAPSAEKVLAMDDGLKQVMEKCQLCMAAPVLTEQVQ